MSIRIVQLSDLHFEQNSPEEVGVVLESFFDDLVEQVDFEQKNTFLAFSGDIVQAGGTQEQYNQFIDFFDKRLSNVGIRKDRRICVPGNHDLARNVVESSLSEQRGIVLALENEKQFNDYVQSEKNLFAQKFSNYFEFEQSFTDLGIGREYLTGSSHQLADGIAVYCLNSAITSFGGAQYEGEPIEDKGNLAVDTRKLHSWVQSNKDPIKILILHHPINWLTPWAQVEINNLIKEKFALCLHGHNHDQDISYNISEDQKIVTCTAPPLFTTKSGELGYTIIDVSPVKGVSEIHYRHWSKHRKFVAGTYFSNTDTGTVNISAEISGSKNHKNDQGLCLTRRYLRSKYEEALVSFSGKSSIWVEPNICDVSETSADPDKEVHSENILELARSEANVVIRALPQFGLTCLARRLALVAWESDNPKLWIYLDCKDSKPDHIKREVDSELEYMGRSSDDIHGFIIDSWAAEENISSKYIQKLAALFPEHPLIIMHRAPIINVFASGEGILKERDFRVLYLWSFTRTRMREFITDYIQDSKMGDVNALVKKVAGDLNVLNLHRTPLNCLTLLKVSEVEYEDNPVNRTEMIRRLLFLLFDIDILPTYKSRPDLKDCEYVLGRFCEMLIRENKYNFSRSQFLSEVRAFCKERVIELEIHVVFDMLYSNSIIVGRGGEFCFRFSYWIYYFAAHRMHQDPNFAQFIYSDLRYTSYPELIEFYTGIDRRREDALKVLMRHMKDMCESTKGKTGIESLLDPYQYCEWKPSENSIEKMHRELSQEVGQSNLPAEVKDSFADRDYNRSKPYYQDIQEFLEAYSVPSLIHGTKAAARALRNSDYADPNIRRAFLDQLLQCWEQLSNVIVIISPILAENYQASYDGANFVLTGNFADSSAQRFLQILTNIPRHIVNSYRDDLFSSKMTPLLVEKLRRGSSDFSRHLLMLIMVMERPRDWKHQVQRYIAESPKNSFYLADIYYSLRSEYRYAYLDSKDEEYTRYLIKMAAAKHEFGSKKPGAKMIGKISDRILPKRVVD